MNNSKITGIQDEFQCNLSSQNVRLAFIQVPIQIILPLINFNLLIGLDENKWKVWNIDDYEIECNDQIQKQIQNCFYPILYECQKMLFIMNRGNNWKMISLLNYQVQEKQTSKQIKNLNDRQCMINTRFIHYSSEKLFYMINLHNQKKRMMVMQKILYDSYGGIYITAIQTTEQQYLITTKFSKLIRVSQNIQYGERYQFSDLYTLLKEEGQVYNNLTLKEEYSLKQGFKDVMMINYCQNDRLKSDCYLIILYDTGIQILEMVTYQYIYNFKFTKDLDYNQIIYDYNNHEIIVLIKQKQIKK
ncbi:hypothetical protein pb186bvf_011328 [Paramecium bursaria]